MKKLILMMLMASGFYGNNLFAAWGLFEADRSWIIFNSGSYTVWSNGSGTIQNADLGTFINAEALTLSGYDVKTYKNGDSDVTGGTFYYVIYPKNNRPVSPIFQSQALGWMGDLGGGDQRWGFSNLTINLLNGLSAGEYTLEFYAQVNGTNPDESKYDNNNTINNYTAHFRYNYVRSIANGNWDESSSWLNSKIPGSSQIAEINHNITASGNISGSSVIIKSNAINTGSLIHSTAGIQATVERYVASHGNVSDAGWHLLASPVATFNIAGSSFQPGASDDLYAWSENSNTWLNYKVGNPTQIVPGNGYLVAYENTGAKSFTGNLNVSNVSVSSLAHNATQGKGWHLLGNPFASALEWNKTGGSWALSNVAGTAKVWNSETKAYVDVVANGIIPSAQGFFVQVNESTTGSLTIPAAARAHSSIGWYKNTTTRLLLSASPADGSSRQESQIRIEPEATSSFDFYNDSRFLLGYAPQFYSIVGSEKLSTNSIPEINTDLSIPFGFVKNQATSFIIELSETIEGKTIYLTDLKTNTIQKLSENPIYSFTSSEGDDPNRFLLHFGLVSVGEQLPTETLQAYAYNDRLFVNSSLEKASLSVYDLQGRLFLQRQINESGLQSVEMKMPAGVYIVRMQNSQQSKSVKIVVQ